MGINPNRAFFIADASAGEGVQAYSLSIPFDWVEKEDGGDSYQFKAISLQHFVQNAEKIHFYPWRDAIRRTPDALALAAIAQLVAEVL